MADSSSCWGWRSVALCCLLLLVVAPLPAAAATRALIVTADYGGAGEHLRLGNAVVDGRLVATALYKTGVTDVQLIEEPDGGAWQDGLAAFLGRLKPQDTALLYYAGHGLQVSGHNYFLAADGASLLPTDRIVQQIADRAGATVIIIDACRNNPFRKSDSDSLLQIETTGAISRAVTTVSAAALGEAGPGLAQMSELRGSSIVILFSTDPGNVALDGEPGQNSPFARVTAAELARRQSLNSAFRRITAAVRRETAGAQSPWRQGDLPNDVFLAGMQYFPVP